MRLLASSVGVARVQRPCHRDALERSRGCFSRAEHVRGEQDGQDAGRAATNPISRSVTNNGSPEATMFWRVARSTDLSHGDAALADSLKAVDHVRREMPRAGGRPQCASGAKARPWAPRPPDNAHVRCLRTSFALAALLRVVPPGVGRAACRSDPQSGARRRASDGSTTTTAPQSRHSRHRISAVSCPLSAVHRHTKSASFPARTCHSEPGSVGFESQ